MQLRFGAARLVGALSTRALKHVFRRPAANFPGKAGLVVDPQLIAHLRSRLREGAVVVVGTNGKTTVTNLLADTLEAAGKVVACNRTGANLDSGVATTLLHTRTADWGVLESDELWLAKIAPQLRPDYIVLLNLFRDQLDRAGEIDHVQESIVRALAASPETTLVYNADDPLCQAIADAVKNERIAFGIGEDLRLPQNTVADAGVCQRCDSMLDYAWRQYGQLGKYSCPTCGFTREEPHWQARDVAIGADGTSLTVCVEPEGRGRSHGPATWDSGPMKSAPTNQPATGTQIAELNRGEAPSPFTNQAAAPMQIAEPNQEGMRSSCANRPAAGTQLKEVQLHTALPGAYMAYNLLAVCAAADCCRAPLASVEQALHNFAPHNGRLQAYEIDGRRVLLNLAKNPTGFNQNLRIILDHSGPKAAAFFINDKEADGRDVSWLWDVDFQELAADGELIAFAGGLRRNDMQVRLKYAGIDAPLVDSASDFLAKAAAMPHDAAFFLIANYTALPGVKAELDQMRHLPQASSEVQAKTHPIRMAANALSQQKLVITHLYPELLNLYGDGGNVAILAARARARGIQVDIVRVPHGQEADLDRADIVFLGGGPDREQRLASTCLLAQADALRDYVEDDGVLLAICGGFQIIGREWLLGDELVPGLGLVDITTRRADGGSHNRIVGNVVLESPLANLPVVGYENHAGRTFLGPGCEPFGRIVGKHGTGNNDGDRIDGALYRNVVGTYLHGPLLAKSPEVADHLITRALTRRAAKEGRVAPALTPLDDAIERAANAAMA